MAFFWKARSALAVMNSANAGAEERAKAGRLWTTLYRTVHASRDETSGERGERIKRIDKLAAVAGLAPILFHLREFAFDISHAVLTSPDPVAKLANIFNRKAKRGPKERDFKRRIEIAAAVQRCRNANMTLQTACESVARDERPKIGRDAVRRIYENAMKKKADASAVRLVAAKRLEF